MQPRPSPAFWSVREHSLAEIWQSSPAFNAFRGTGLDEGAVRQLSAAV